MSERFRARLDVAMARAVPLEKVFERFPELDEHAKVTRAGLPAGFRYRRDGHIEHLVGEDEHGEPIWAWLCSPIEVQAITRDQDQQAWGRLLQSPRPMGTGIVGPCPCS